MTTQKQYLILINSLFKHKCKICKEPSTYCTYNILLTTYIAMDPPQVSSISMTWPPAEPPPARKHILPSMQHQQFHLNNKNDKWAKTLQSPTTLHNKNNRNNNLHQKCKIETRYPTACM